jgi:DNA helicase II / ATP-dependent DNA helicase PcrA
MLPIITLNISSGKLMKFIADLHIHSRFSRATAKNLDFENLYLAARIRGITVVATGDFTHPGWFTEV